MTLPRRLASLVLVLLPGCDSTPPDEEFCNMKCACIGTCGTTQVKECLAEYQRDRSHAIEVGCEEPFEQWSSCISDGLGCQLNDYDAGCLAPKDRWQACVANR